MPEPDRFLDKYELDPSALDLAVKDENPGWIAVEAVREAIGLADARALQWHHVLVDPPESLVEVLDTLCAATIQMRLPAP